MDSICVSVSQPAAMGDHRGQHEDATMKICTLMAVALATVALVATPSQAQRSSADPGNYWEVSRIDVLPGQMENYLDYLNKQ